jgi:hypothetical protein
MHKSYPAGFARDENWHIEISLRNIKQLFNSMDPSPFLERDLDQDAEEFLVGWALEHVRNRPLQLTLHLQEWPQELNSQQQVREAVRNYFAYRKRQSDMNLRELLRQGRVSLLVGLSFLTICLLLSDYLSTHAQGTFAGIVQESLSIGGWVAMWRPLQTYLYDWWPIRHRSRTYEWMSRMNVVLEHVKTSTT